MNVFYSTPSCYLKSLHDSNIEWPTKSDDFFPHANDPHAYWNGYYTSRPTSKRFERVGNQFLQICKKLSATAKIPESHFDGNLNRLKQQMGAMQHHDAVTGTEKQHVAEDYHLELHASIVGCEANTRSSLNQFMTGKEPTNSSTEWEFHFDSCLNLNISVCAVPENAQKFMLTVYNPLGQSTSLYVRFPVGGDNYEVRDSQNFVLAYQMVPIPVPLREIPYRQSVATNELVFQAVDVPAMGYKSYFVSRVTAQLEIKQTRQKRLAEPVTIGNDELMVSFDENGFLSEITVDGEASKLSQNFVIYKGAMGNNEVFENRSSGAYIFRPDPLEDEELVGRTTVTLEVFKGEQVDEVHQIFNKWISQVVRIYKTQKFVEFEWLVGPIDVDDGVGKEIVSRFYTDIKSDGFLFTDSNGREMMRRKRNFRETWEFVNEEPIAGNYYPINSKIVIEDETHRLALLVDRAQGGASIFDGTVELMVSFDLLFRTILI